MNWIQEHKILTKGTKICKVLQLHNWKLPSMAHFPIIVGLFWKTYDLLQVSLKVALEWYITFLTKQCCKALKGGTASLKKRGPRRLPHHPSLISITELALCLVGKAHVTKMKLNLNFFPLRLQIPQIRCCIFKKPVICTNLITCSAKLSLHAAERGH